MPKLSPKQILMLAMAVLGWASVYLLQEFDYTRFTFMPGQYYDGVIAPGEEWRFAVNKGMRFLFNDLFSLLFIYALFNTPRYTRLALLVMAFGVLILLPAYLILAIYFGKDGRHLLVFLHRITMNPWLMLILVPGFLYQDWLANNRSGDPE